MSHIKVPLLDLKPQINALKDEIITAVSEVVTSGQYVLGPKVEQFEQEMCAYTGSPYALGVSSGTDALLLALMALDVGTNDKVLTTTFSFFATAGVISRLNAQPVFIDIEENSYNMCPESLKNTLEAMSKSEHKQVKAIIPVHLYGQCADMAPIMNVASKYGIKVIEDAAQALGSQYKLDGKKHNAGTMGDIGCYSFFPTKNLGGIGDSGMVVCKDPKLFEILKSKRVHGQLGAYLYKSIGGNFRIDPIQAVVLSIKLKHLNNWHKARQKNADSYTFGISELHIPGLKLPKTLYKKDGLPNYHIYNQYMVRCDDREGLQHHLADNQIDSRVYYPLSFHQQDCFENLGYKKGDFPVAEKVSKDIMSLPIYPDLTKEQVKHVISTINNYYN